MCTEMKNYRIKNTEIHVHACKSHARHMLLSDIKSWEKELESFRAQHLCGLYKVLFRVDNLQLLKM